MRVDSAQGPMCVACTINLAETIYKVCIASTTSMETQTDSWEIAKQEPVDDAANTQEPIAEIENSMGGDPRDDTQEPTEDAVVTKEPKVEGESNQEQKEETSTQEPIDYIAVTQEPTTEMEQLNPQDAVTPLSDSACRGT